MKICLISRDATYGNGAALAEGLKNFADVETIFYLLDTKGLYQQTNCKITNRIPQADHYIIMGAISLESFPENLYSKGVTIVLCGTAYRNNPTKYNKIITENKWNLWAMPDLAPTAGTNNVYYQPFIIPDVDKTKRKAVCHSPSHPSKLKEKGTKLIGRVCLMNNIPITIIMGKTWMETIEIKAKHHIVIDQIGAGLGKSGLEAMLLGCVVLSGIKPVGDNIPPIRWTDREHLEADLINVWTDSLLRNQIIEEQYEWANFNLNPINVAQKIINSIT